MAQGYLFARPMPGVDMTAALDLHGGLVGASAS
jgi:EAL domain-containing protein (putative c-di-GMP-specific phosphodiesterase class I)